MLWFHLNASVIDFLFFLSFELEQDNSLTPVSYPCIAKPIHLKKILIKLKHGRNRLPFQPTWAYAFGVISSSLEYFIPLTQHSKQCFYGASCRIQNMRTLSI